MTAALATASRVVELFEEHPGYLDCLRLTGDLIQRWDRAPAVDRARMVVEPPRTALRHRTTRKWGARLAATVEELCRRDGIPVPSWVDDPTWTLSWRWYPLLPERGAGPALRAVLRETTPPAFRRPGGGVRGSRCHRPYLTGRQPGPNERHSSPWSRPIRTPAGGLVRWILALHEDHD